MSWFTFDIETGPLPAEQLEAIIPPFDPSEVKCGNLKDPDKIAAKIAEAEASHKQCFIDRAALDPATGRVVAVGIYGIHADEFLPLVDHEEVLLSKFWSFVESKRPLQPQFVGVNILGFDLPFLVKRSWMLDVPVPQFVADISAKWCNWHPMFMDLRLIWQLGDRQARSSFDHIGKCLGTGGKTEGDCGKDFASLLIEDRDKAIAYLRNDCEQPAIWLRKMGFIK